MTAGIEFDERERGKMMALLAGNKPLPEHYKFLAVFRYIRDNYTVVLTSAVEVNTTFWDELTKLAPVEAAALKQRMSFVKTHDNNDESAARAFGVLRWVGDMGCELYGWFGGAKSWDRIYEQRFIRRNGDRFKTTIVHLLHKDARPTLEALPFVPLANEVLVIESVPSAIGSGEATNFPVAAKFIRLRYKALGQLYKVLTNSDSFDAPYVPLKVRKMRSPTKVKCNTFSLALGDTVKLSKVPSSRIKVMDLLGEDDLYIRLSDFYESSATIKLLEDDDVVMDDAKKIIIDGDEVWVTPTGATGDRLLLLVPTPRLTHYSLAVMGRYLSAHKNKAGHITDRDGEGYVVNEEGYIAFGISSNEPDEPFKSLNESQLDQLVVVSFEEVRAVGDAAVRYRTDLTTQTQIAAFLPADTPDSTTSMLAKLVVACGCRSKASMQHCFKGYNRAGRYVGQVVKI